MNMQVVVGVVIAVVSAFCAGAHYGRYMDRTSQITVMTDADLHQCQKDVEKLALLSMRQTLTIAGYEALTNVRLPDPTKP